MNTRLNNLTIKEVSEAAEQNSEKYIDRAKSIAKNAFIEGVAWAQKVARTNQVKYD